MKECHEPRAEVEHAGPSRRTGDGSRPGPGTACSRSLAAGPGYAVLPQEGKRRGMLRWLATRRARLRDLRSNEDGALSVLSLVLVLGLTILFGSLINIGRVIDDKQKLQNAADASAYSSAGVLARGLNGLAFSNHLLSDTFAITAFLREARDRNAESLVPPILAAWTEIVPILSRSEFPKIRDLGPAVATKVPLEQEAVTAYGEMSAAVAEELLPVFEYSLRERLIPEFERALVQSIPMLAQLTANDLAYRHGLHPAASASRREERERGPQLGVLWRTSVIPVGYNGEQDPLLRSLPAIDPSPGLGPGQTEPVPDPTPDGMEGRDAASLPWAATYLAEAQRDRERYAREYLRNWIDDRLRFFAVEGKMSQYINLYHVLACGQLQRLLNEEYPRTNLPHMIRRTETGLDPDELRNPLNALGAREHLERHHTFVGVAYRLRMRPTMRGIFQHPLGHDPVCFAQVEVFLPQGRLYFNPGGMSNPSAPDIGGGGVGVDIGIPLDPGEPRQVPPGWGGEGWPVNWSLWSQNWTVRLVPATAESVPAIVESSPPPTDGAVPGQYRGVLPPLTRLSRQAFQALNGH